MVYTSGERVKEIVKIFTKYGLSYIVDKKNKKDKKSPANLRKAFEELGPTFIKIGQILSSRSDLIGEEYIRELSKLQDKAAIEGFSEFEEIFRNEFSKELLDSFLYINKEPIASASIAQVYFGVLNDGREVVIKIQRPNIKERMYIDLDILISLSEKYNHIFKESVVSVKDTLMEIRKSTVNELDFISEANNIRKFRELNKERNYIYAPYVVNELSGEKVLTLENINGFKINDIKVHRLHFSKCLHSTVPGQSGSCFSPAPSGRPHTEHTPAPRVSVCTFRYPQTGRNSATDIRSPASA